MDTTHCINNETWELYASNNLGVKELAALQKHAKTCELCGDIKEGIDALSNPVTLSAEVEALNQKVDEYLAPNKPKRIPIWYWSAAAVLLVSLGVGWLYTQTTVPNEVVVKTDPILKNEKIDSLVKPQVEKKTDIDKKAITIPTETTKDKKQPAKESAVKEKYTNGADAKDKPSDGEKKNLEFKKDYKDVAKAKKKEATFDAELNTELDKKMVVIDTVLSRRSARTTINEGVTKKTQSAKDILPSAMFNNYFNNSNMGLTNSYNWPEVIVTTDSLNYYEGVKNFDAKEFTLCIANLDSVIINITSSYYERALFLKAKAYIKQNKNKEAKKQLNAIIALNRNYKKEAAELLKTLK